MAKQRWGSTSVKEETRTEKRADQSRGGPHLLEIVSRDTREIRSSLVWPPARARTGRAADGGPAPPAPRPRAARAGPAEICPSFFDHTSDIESFSEKYLTI